MKGKKIIVFVAVVLIFAILGTAFGILYAENKIFLNVLTVYETEQYLANYRNTNETVTLQIIDSVKYFESLDTENATVTFYSDEGSQTAKIVFIAQYKEREFKSPYAVYSVIFALPTGNTDKIVTYHSISINDKTFDIGSVTIETCGETPPEILSLGATVSTGDCIYSIPAIKNKGETEGQITSISFMFNQTVYELINEPITISPGGEEYEFEYNLDSLLSRDNINFIIKAKVIYECDNQEYIFYPLSSTNFKTLITKEEVISFLTYLNDKNDG